MSISEKTPDELKRIADRLHNHMVDARRVLYEIQREAIAKGSYKKIWMLAHRALKCL
jgi:hypothetical protein